MSPSNRWLALAIAWNALVVGSFLTIGARAVFPYSEDMGFQIQMADKLLGAEYRPYSTANPPLFFMLVALLRIVLTDGLWPAYVLVQVSAGLGGVALFLLLRDHVRDAVAAAVSAFYVVAPGIVQMTSWGGGPNLLAIAFLLLSIRSLLRLTRGVGGHIPFVVWTIACGATHIPTFFLLTASALWPVLAGAGSTRRPAVRALLMAAAASLLLLPFYVPVLHGMAPAFGSAGWEGWIEEGIRSVFRAQVYAWALATVAAVLGFSASLKKASTRPLGAWGLSVVGLLVALSLTFWLPLPSRAAYYGYIVILSGTALAIDRVISTVGHWLIQRRIPLAAFSLVLLLSVSFSAAADKVDATAFYGWPNDELIHVAQALGPPDEHAVLAPGEVAWRLGALSKRFVYSANDPLWLQFEAERRDLYAANLIYWGEWSLASGHTFVHVVSSPAGYDVLIRATVAGKWQEVATVGPFAEIPLVEAGAAPGVLAISGVPVNATEVRVVLEEHQCRREEMGWSVDQEALRARPALAATFVSMPDGLPTNCDREAAPWSLPDHVEVLVTLDGVDKLVLPPPDCAGRPLLAFAVVPSKDAWLASRFDTPAWSKEWEAEELQVYATSNLTRGPCDQWLWMDALGAAE